MVMVIIGGTTIKFTALELITTRLTTPFRDILDNPHPFGLTIARNWSLRVSASVANTLNRLVRSSYGVCFEC